MSQFTFTGLKTYFRALFESCSTSVEDRQKASEEKLKQQLLLQEYQLNDLQRKITDLETRKDQYVKAKRVKEATEAVREKHKYLKKLAKARELRDFTESLLLQISDAAVLKDTMHTLSEAQTVFQTIDAGRVYKRFDKLSEQYSMYKTQIDDATGLMQDRMSDVTASSSGLVDDDDLKAELEELMATVNGSAQSNAEAASSSVAPASNHGIVPVASGTSPQMQAPQQVVDMSSLYARAGLI
jgi:hypothetical protein